MTLTKNKQEASTEIWNIPPYYNNRDKSKTESAQILKTRAHLVCSVTVLWKLPDLLVVFPPYNKKNNNNDNKTLLLALVLKAEPTRHPVSWVRRNSWVTGAVVFYTFQGSGQAASINFSTDSHGPWAHTREKIWVDTGDLRVLQRNPRWKEKQEY